MTAINYSALTTPPDRAAVTAYRAAERAKPGGSGTSSAQVIIAIVGISVVLFGMLVGFLGLAVAALSSAPQGGVGSVVIAFFLPVAVVIVGVVVLVVILRAVVGGNNWQRWYRLDRFASANGLVFGRSDRNPNYPGSIFGQGSDRVVTEHLRSASGRFLDYGNYRYTTGSGKSRSVHDWGFLALQLDRALPNMVLDATSNNGLFGGTNLPAYFSKKQILHLEGDFDRYFTLYCPQEYERDALYIFTPDLMALLIDEASPFDVEIIDSWMFVYSGSTFDLSQPAIHERLFTIIETVGAKTLTQTDRYVDERVGDVTANIVAPQGQRLKRGVSVGAVIFIAGFSLVWIWSFLSDAISSILGR